MKKESENRLKNVGVIGLKYLVAIACLYYLYENGKLNFLSLSAIAKDAALCLQVLCLLAVILTMGVWKWFLILRAQKIDITFARCFVVFYIGSAFNYLLPGGIAGDIVKGGYMINEKEGRARAVLSILVDRLMGLFSMMVIVASLFPFSKGVFFQDELSFFQDERVAIAYVLGLLLFIYMALKICFFLLRRRGVHRKVHAFLHKRRNNNRFYRIGLSLVESLFMYRDSVPTLMQNISIAVVIQIVIGYSLFLIGASFAGGDEASLFNNILASIVTQLVGIIPISPGGLGIGEAAFEGVMSHLTNQALCPFAAVYLAYRVYNILFGLPAIIMFVFGPKRFLAVVR